MRPWPKDDKNLLAQIFRAFSKTTLKTSENSLSTLKLHIAKDMTKSPAGLWAMIPYTPY
jgi:hypothetical protein